MAIAPVKKPADVSFHWDEVVIGADLDAVNHAHEHSSYLIKNRNPYHHSYDGCEEEWAEKLYELHARGLCPFVDKSNKIRVYPEDRLLKVFTDHNVYVVEYAKLSIYDDENIEGFSLNRELLGYRVIDWFDCQGLRSLSLDHILTQDQFVNKIKFFKTLRVDGDQKYVDVLCESFLTENQLKSFEYSDTMVRFKILELLKKHGVDNPKMSLWKRDTYPVYK